MKPGNVLRHLHFVATLAIVPLLLPEVAYGQGGIPGYPSSIYAFDAREVAVLPRYCIHTQHFREKVPGGQDPGQIDRWSTVLGETYNHMHHYCYGLMFLHRATVLAREAHVRTFYFGNALKEFDYVLERAPQGFVLTPEILTKKGEALIRLGRGPLAIEPLERAIELKPDYWPPYAHLSDYFKDTGDLKAARSTLETGLSNSPDAKALQRRLAELSEGAERKTTPKPSRKPESTMGR